MIRVSRTVVAFAALLMLPACSRKPTPAPPDAAPPAPDAGASQGALEDLLHFTDAHLAVSSKVDNPRDRAEHIADGLFETAWNGKTGDLVGGWMAFRVPRETRVRAIELTVGYDARSRKGEDLFFANHRIERVKVLRDGVPIGEHALDPDKRGLQRISFVGDGQPGGDFKIEVLAVKPGTRAAWRELVISELRVLGRAGAARRATPGLPRVSVGGFDDRPPLSRGAEATDAGARAREPQSPSASTAAALCAEWHKEADEEFVSTKARGQEGPCPPAEFGPSCSTGEIASERGVTLYSFSTSDSEEREGLALGYRKRVHSLDTTVSSHHVCDPGCRGSRPGGQYIGFRVEGPPPAVAVVTYVTWLAGDPYGALLDDGGSDPARVTSSYEKHELKCKLGAGSVQCDDGVVATKTVVGIDAPQPPAEWLAAADAAAP